MSILKNISFLLLIAVAESSRFSDWGSDDRRIPGLIKGSSYQSQFIFEIIVGKRRIPDIKRLWIWMMNILIDSKLIEDVVIQIQSRSMSDPTLSDIDLK